MNNIPNLTKNSVRFSKLIRPNVGEVIEFSPVIVLCRDVFVSDMREFMYDYMVEGAKCKVIENCEHTVAVEFEGEEGVKMLVSPEFLIKRELTDAAIKALKVLKEKLNIG